MDSAAVLLVFGVVSAQSQATTGMLLRQSLAKKPKILAPHGYSIPSNAPSAEVKEKTGRGQSRGGFAWLGKRGKRVKA
jgi:hypothetical protein